jgi:NAD(P)-dependent dehydrogenase (short-subunit alcohol dehydrogenase family)
VSKNPQVAVVISPFHEIGLTLCRLLALEGMRMVVVDRDPMVGEAFCRRLGLEGFSATYRFVDPDLAGCEAALREDLADVYGRIHCIISFFEPVSGGRPLNWLELSPTVAWQLMERTFSWRLRLLKALAPLFPIEDGGIILNVMMGADKDGASGRLDATVASMVDQLLAPEWANRNVVVRQIATNVSGFTPGTRDDELTRLNEDVRQIIQMLNADAGDRVVEPV